jgi:hypothetical protein
LKEVGHVYCFGAEADEFRFHAGCDTRVDIAVVGLDVAVDLGEESGDAALDFALWGCGGEDAGEDVGLLLLRCGRGERGLRDLDVGAVAACGFLLHHYELGRRVGVVVADGAIAGFVVALFEEEEGG